MPRRSADPALDDVDLRTLMSYGASRLLRAAATRLFGFDYFVSYARHDASAYAERLAGTLESRGYYTCLDRTDLLPDDVLDESLRRAARRSRYTVLVDSAGARMSKYVADEVHAVHDLRHRLVRRRGLVRICAPQRRPLATSAGAGEPDLPWRHLSPAALEFLQRKIAVDHDLTPDELTRGTVPDDVVRQVVSAYGRVRVLRRFWTVVVLCLILIAASAITAVTRTYISLASRELAVAAVSGPPDLEELYRRAGRLAAVMRLAEVPPLLVPRALMAETQDSLRAALRVAAAPRMRLPNPVGFELGRRRLVLAARGTVVFWRSRRGLIELSRVDDPGSPASPPVPIAGTALDWYAGVDTGAARISIAHPDRLEVWSSPVGAAAPTVRICRAGLRWTHAVVGDTHAAGISDGPPGRTIDVVSLTECALAWSAPLAVDDAPSLQFAGTSLIVSTSSTRQVLAAADGRLILKTTVPPSETGSFASAFDTVRGRLATLAGPLTIHVTADGETLPLDHQQPVLGMALSPDGAMLASVDTAQLSLWRLGSTSAPPEPELEVSRSWLQASLAFSGPARLLLVTVPPSDQGFAQLHTLLVPSGLSLQPTPLGVDAAVELHAAGSTIVVGGRRVVEVVVRAPEELPGAVWRFEEMPDRSGNDTAGGRGDGIVRRSHQAGIDIGSDGTELRSTATIGLGELAPGRYGLAGALADTETWSDCSVRLTPPYAAIVCPDLVRVFRLHHRFQWLPPRTEVVGTRWTDLHCMEQAKGCAPIGNGLRVSDVQFDGRTEEVTVRYATGRGALLVTHTLRFATLRSRFRELQRAVEQ